MLLGADFYLKCVNILNIFIAAIAKKDMLVFIVLNIHLLAPQILVAMEFVFLRIMNMDILVSATKAGRKKKAPLNALLILMNVKLLILATLRASTYLDHSNVAPVQLDTREMEYFVKI